MSAGTSTATDHQYEYHYCSVEFTQQPLWCNGLARLPASRRSVFRGRGKVFTSYFGL